MSSTRRSSTESRPRIPRGCGFRGPSQHPPRRRRQTARVRQGLKNEIAVWGAIAQTAQRQRKSVRRVVSEIEAALEREVGVGGVGKAGFTRSSEAFDLARRGRLPF